MLGWRVGWSDAADRPPHLCKHRCSPADHKLVLPPTQPAAAPPLLSAPHACRPACCRRGSSPWWWRSRALSTGRSARRRRPSWGRSGAGPAPSQVRAVLRGRGRRVRAEHVGGPPLLWWSMIAGPAGRFCPAPSPPPPPLPRASPPPSPPPALPPLCQATGLSCSLTAATWACPRCRQAKTSAQTGTAALKST